MIHPLIGDLSHLNENELGAKITDLSNKYWQVHSPGLQNQISLMLEVYNNELAERRMKTWQKTNDNKNLNDLIKIR